MELSALTAISPLDGRYGSKVAALRDVLVNLVLLNAALRSKFAGYSVLLTSPALLKYHHFRTVQPRGLIALSMSSPLKMLSALKRSRQRQITMSKRSSIF